VKEKPVGIDNYMYSLLDRSMKPKMYSHLGYSPTRLNGHTYWILLN